MQRGRGRERKERNRWGFTVLKGLPETTQEARVLLTMCAEVIHSSKTLRGRGRGA